MTPDVASERSIFCKNHDWNSYNYRVFRVAVNNAPIFRGVDVRGGRKLYTNRHTHTRDSHSDDNNKDYSKRCSSIGIIQRTVYIYVCKTAQHEAHVLFWNNTQCFTRKQTCNGEYTKHCTRSRHQLKMAAPAEVSEKRSNFRIRQF